MHRTWDFCWLGEGGLVHHIRLKLRLYKPTGVDGRQYEGG